MKLEASLSEMRYGIFLKKFNLIHEGVMNSRVGISGRSSTTYLSRLRSSAPPLGVLATDLHLHLSLLSDLHYNIYQRKNGARPSAT